MKRTLSILAAAILIFSMGSIAYAEDAPEGVRQYVTKNTPQGDDASEPIPILGLDTEAISAASGGYSNSDPYFASLRPRPSSGRSLRGSPPVLAASTRRLPPNSDRLGRYYEEIRLESGRSEDNAWNIYGRTVRQSHNCKQRTKFFAGCRFIVCTPVIDIVNIGGRFCGDISCEQFTGCRPENAERIPCERLAFLKKINGDTGIN